MVERYLCEAIGRYEGLIIVFYGIVCMIIVLCDTKMIFQLKYRINVGMNVDSKILSSNSKNHRTH